MSSLVVVNQGEDAFLDLIVGLSYTVHLFTNDVTAGLTPSQIDALDETDFTEATFPGYASTTAQGVDWTVTPADPSVATNVQKTFTRSSTGTAEVIRGYYVLRSGALRWFEQWDGPVSIEFINDQINITPELTLDDVRGNAVETGVITAFGGATAPTGWLLCDGTAVSRSTYADLFAAVGTAFGTGDGSTTFNLPDLRQRFPLGKAASGTGATLGGTGGAVDHVHALGSASSFAALTAAATGSGPIRIQRKNVTSWTNTHQVITGAVTGIGTSDSTGIALGGDSDTENPPFQVVNFIIKT